MEQIRWKRPWLAALLGVLGTGFGHVYLRRWWRAAGWFFASFLTSWWFVPEETLQTASTLVVNPGSASVSALPMMDLLPVYLVLAASAIDAYVIARMNNRLLMEQRQGIQRCDSCGRQLDPDVSFCQWCGTDQDET
ncbi:zinc ribbon domain-containing protein [Halocatena salina]|uniref:Zinc ribbon domain-containing protein n=1 Tax=Halocatena salina TaxID=2934340 RepID=A0A8U0A3R7_9EURY|nr:zinc ribbon domain-containing protein [Halocatena salina]UPM43845.1 zinc ribbon domain-containing protein [Halocatena salina]